MAKTRAERIESIKTEIAQLENQRKRLLQAEKEQERKDRTRRLCKRAGLLESLLPETIPLTDEQFKTFLEKAVISVTSRRILDELTAQTDAATAPQSAGSAARDIPIPASKTIHTAQENGEDGDANEGNSRATPEA